MNPYDQSLDSMFKVYGDWNPFAYMKGMDSIDKSGQYNDQSLREATLKNNREEQAIPLDMTLKDLTNKTRAAELPGVEANSALTQDKARASRETLDSHIATMLSDNKTKMSDNDLKQLSGMAQTFTQAGQLVDKLPGPMSHARARELLGKAYLPEFDQVPPDILGKVLNYVGDSMNQASLKHQQALQMAGMKSDTAAALEAERTRRAIEVQNLKNQSAEKVAKLRAEAVSTKDPKKFEELAVRHKMAAEGADSPEEARKHMEQAAMALEAAKLLRPMDNTKPQLDPGVAPGVLTAPPTRENPLSPNVAKPDPLGIR